jgi:hypothetical protein
MPPLPVRVWGRLLVVPSQKLNGRPGSVVHLQAEDVRSGVVAHGVELELLPVNLAQIEADVKDSVVRGEGANSMFCMY